jgi:phosphoserine aminotransferase
MTNRVFNFSAGPATLPLEVLEIAQRELLDYKGTGMSIIENSHRSPEYDEINDSCIALFKEIFNLNDDYHVLFVGGGASSQFAIVPMNFLTADKTGAYIDTGTWSNKAIKEAKFFGNVHVAASSKESNYDHIPTEFDVPSDAAYLHMTSNNTIFGTQFQTVPDSKGLPLICDMSSDIGSRVHDFNKFDIIYAGAQKNLGPAGVTVVIISDEMLGKCNENIPTMFSYKTHADKKSLFNTPPVFGVYFVKLVLEWIKNQGGLTEVEKINIAKKERIYQLMDLNPEYFRGTVQPDSRSWMNITMRLPNEDLEKKCIAEAKSAGFTGLKGHRSVGGIRISTYNAMPKEGIERLAEFFEEFKTNNPA